MKGDDDDDADVTMMMMVVIVVVMILMMMVVIVVVMSLFVGSLHFMTRDSREFQYPESVYAVGG